MRVLIIGGSGTIGKAIVDDLSSDHDVVTAGRNSGDHRVDIADKTSVESLFRAVGPVDAVVSAAGSAAWKPLSELTDEDFQFSLSNKLMGQVNLARVALPHLNDGGSITLTSGILSRNPSPGSVAVSLVNAGLEGFTRAAALDLPRGIRINVVSPPWVSETLEQMGSDPSSGLPARRVAEAYRESVEGTATGQVIDAR